MLTPVWYQLKYSSFLPFQSCLPSDNSSLLTQWRGIKRKEKRSKLHIDQTPYFKAFNDTMGSQISIRDKVKSLESFDLLISVK